MSASAAATAAANEAPEKHVGDVASEDNDDTYGGEEEEEEDEEDMDHSDIEVDKTDASVASPRRREGVAPTRAIEGRGEVEAGSPAAAGKSPTVGKRKERRSSSSTDESTWQEQNQEGRRV